MSRSVAILLKVGIPLVVLLVVGVVWFGRPDRSGDTGSQDVWTCSMHPQVRQPRPGKCPICGMDLIPVSQLAAAQAANAASAGVATEPVAYRELAKELRTVGKLDYSERQVAYISARIAGRVDRVHADFVGVPVKKGEHLVDIYSPDLFVAQGELIRAVQAAAQAKQRAGTAEAGYAEANLEAARTKLRLLGLLPEQIRAIEESKEIRSHLTIYAPIGGTVVEKMVRPGQYVKEGDMLYRIADLDPLWLFLDVYESDLTWVQYGQPVDVAVEAYPGETFRGTVVFIDPFLDDKTRTVKVRVNLKNAERKLKPAMYASATIRVRLRADGLPEPTGVEGKYLCPMHPEVVREQPGQCPVCEMPLERVPERKPPATPKGHEHDHQAHAGHGAPKNPGASNKVLAAPVSAVLDTGRRKLVYRVTSGGDFEPVEVRTGPRAEGNDDAGKKAAYYPVLEGLQAGDRVVVRGGFLVDSQRQIKGEPSLLAPQGQSAANLHSGHAPPPQPAEKAHKH